MKTVVFTNMLTSVVCMLVILVLWAQVRRRFAGTGFWVIDFAFQTTAIFLIVLRGSIPDWISMVLANTLVVAGALFGYMGLGRFTGKRLAQVHNYFLLAAFAASELSRKGKVKEREFQFRRKSGEKFTGLFSAEIIRANDQVLALSRIGDITERKRAEVERERLIQELRDALGKVKLLSGMLPICSSCKKVRDDKGYWTQIESYVRSRSEADFSHSICPDCAKKLYPEMNPYDEDRHNGPVS